MQCLLLFLSACAMADSNTDERVQHDDTLIDAAVTTEEAEAAIEQHANQDIEYELAALRLVVERLHGKEAVEDIIAARAEVQEAAASAIADEVVRIQHKTAKAKAKALAAAAVEAKELEVKIADAKTPEKAE